MRRKMTADEKRNSPIGIKVKTETRKQLDYISEAEGHTLSTYIDIVLRKHIEDYLSSHNINWDTISDEEKENKQ